MLVCDTPTCGRPSPPPPPSLAQAYISLVHMWWYACVSMHGEAEISAEESAGAASVIQVWRVCRGCAVVAWLCRWPSAKQAARRGIA